VRPALLSSRGHEESDDDDPDQQDRHANPYAHRHLSPQSLGFADRMNPAATATPITSAPTPLIQIHDHQTIRMPNPTAGRRSSSRGNNARSLCQPRQDALFALDLSHRRPAGAGCAVRRLSATAGDSTCGARRGHAGALGCGVTDVLHASATTHSGQGDRMRPAKGAALAGAQDSESLGRAAPASIEAESKNPRNLAARPNFLFGGTQRYTFDWRFITTED